MHAVRKFFVDQRSRFVLACSALLLAVALQLAPEPVRAQSGGYSQVSRLELAYVPGSQALRARVTLASGLTLAYQTTTERDINALLGVAEVFAQKGTRMFVEVSDDLVQSFQVSIP